MRVAVIGTSNAVMKNGYFFGISAHSNVSQALNFSLGASTSVSLPLWQEKARFSDFDFIIFDFAINEEYCIRTERGSIRDIKGCLMSFISRWGIEGPIPVFAVLPSLNHVGVPTPVRDFYRDTAAEFGYPFFDGYDFLKDRGYKLAVEPDGAFKDADHLKRELGFEFGLEIADRLSMIDRFGLNRGLSDVEIGSYHYKMLSGCLLSGAEIFERQTSLISTDVVRLLGEASVQVFLPGKADLIGIGLNIAQSNGWVEIESDDGIVRKSVSTKNFSGDIPRLLYSITPVEYLRGDKFIIRLAANRKRDSVIEAVGLTFRDGWGRGKVINLKN